MKLRNWPLRIVVISLLGIIIFPNLWNWLVNDEQGRQVLALFIALIGFGSIMVGMFWFTNPKQEALSWTKLILFGVIGAALLLGSVEIVKQMVPDRDTGMGIVFGG